MKLHSLSSENIEKMASREGVNRIAVENFLMTVHYGDVNAREAYANAQADARSYGWNEDTLAAIMDGITLASTENN